MQRRELSPESDGHCVEAASENTSDEAVRTDLAVLVRCEVIDRMAAIVAHVQTAVERRREAARMNEPEVLGPDLTVWIQTQVAATGRCNRHDGAFRIGEIHAPYHLGISA